MQNVVFTVELFDSQQVTLKEKERANADLLKRVHALSTEKREANEKLAKLQADLDRELVAQQSREGELDQLQKEFWAIESVLRQELSQAREELENISSKLEKRDSELQAASQGLDAANWLAEGIKAEPDRERSVFQSEKDGLLREL